VVQHGGANISTIVSHIQQQVQRHRSYIERFYNMKPNDSVLNTHTTNPAEQFNSQNTLQLNNRTKLESYNGSLMSTLANKFATALPALPAFTPINPDELLKTILEDYLIYISMLNNVCDVECNDELVRNYVSGFVFDIYGIDIISIIYLVYSLIELVQVD
jgi:hypothetical protein